MSVWLECMTVHHSSASSQHSLFIFGHIRPSTSSSLRITDCSFQYASPRLWHQLPAPLRQPRTNLSNSASPSSLSGTSSISSSTHHSHQPSPLHSFTPGLKLSFSANLFHHSLHCTFSSPGLTPRIPRPVYRYF